MSIKSWEIKTKIRKNESLLEALARSRELALENIKEYKIDDLDDLEKIKFKDMNKALERINQSLFNNEKICIYGDYDADGVFATAIIYNFLKERGADVIYYIPDRSKEGYGMNINALKYIKDENVKLIITVDNGICAVKEIEFASKLDMDTVVLDHHVPEERLPKAIALVDANQKDCPSSFKKFCGAALVFLVVLRLVKTQKEKTNAIKKFLDMAAMATISDSVPLDGGNKILVKLSLSNIRNTKNIGLKSLLRDCRLLKDDVTSTDIAFFVVPKLNACGRLSSSIDALKLLITNDEHEAKLLSKRMTELNIKRREIENEILKVAFSFINKNEACLFEPIIVVAAQGFDPGVIGIVASRLVQFYGKPCLVIAINENGKIAKASGRSVENFCLIDAILYCSKFLEKFGGHPMAVGFDIKVENIKLLAKHINNYARNRGGIAMQKITVDCEINAFVLNLKNVKELSFIEPFGVGNPLPNFSIRDVTLIKILPVGEDKHLRLEFEKENFKITAMRFHVCKKEFDYKVGDVLDLVFTLSVSEFKGRKGISVFIKDIHFSNFDVEDLIKQKQIYNNIKMSMIKAETDTKNFKLYAFNFFPQREEFVKVFLFLRKQREYLASKETIYFRLGEKRLSFTKFLLILDIMAELKLLKIDTVGEVFSIKVNKNKANVKFDDSKILKNLESKKISHV
ncbi:MAG: single-stranded-DNA-specific exonuclease RecJ [Oscillospiraceae bacterium]|nr:single-stranded-DNA-specific exonuclease RecJ [Oscillospiraceae bacterium]